MRPLPHHVRTSCLLFLHMSSSRPYAYLPPVLTLAAGDAEAAADGRGTCPGCWGTGASATTGGNKGAHVNCFS